MEAAAYFKDQARECRRLAGDIAAPHERDGLLMLARHYDAEARRAARAVTETGPRPGMPTGH